MSVVPDGATGGFLDEAVAPAFCRSLLSVVALVVRGPFAEGAGRLPCPDGRSPRVPVRWSVALAGRRPLGPSDSRSP